MTLSSAPYLTVGKNMLDPLAVHVAFNGDGLVISDAGALRHAPESNADQYFIWQSSVTRHLIGSPRTTVHGELIKYYTAALTIAENLLKETGK
jgi:hypothetical protein